MLTFKHNIIISPLLSETQLSANIEIERRQNYDVSFNVAMQFHKLRSSSLFSRLIVFPFILRSNVNGLIFGNLIQR